MILPNISYRQPVIPTYAVECPHCAQVIHVANQAVAVDRLARHILAGTDRMCAAWPDHAYRRLRSRHRRRIKRRRWDLEDTERDLGYCAYYLRCVGVPGYENTANPTKGTT